MGNLSFGNGFDSGSANKIEIPLREVSRYLGYKKQKPDEMVMRQIEEVCDLLLKTIDPKALYRIEKLEAVGDLGVQIGDMKIESRALAKNMAGCEYAVLFAATLGVQVDRKLLLFGKTDVTKQVILQAAAAACLEEYIDLLQNQIREEAKKEGFYIRPRFSPGYGDLSLEFQKWLFEKLELSKHLGIWLSDSLLMSPSKSVTALMGVGRQDIHCQHNGCELCKNIDCSYRRE